MYIYILFTNIVRRTCCCLFSKKNSGILLLQITHQFLPLFLQLSVGVLHREIRIIERLKGILWQKYKLGLKVVVFIDEIDGETHFAQLGSSWSGEPKMSRK